MSSLQGLVHAKPNVFSTVLIIDDKGLADGAIRALVDDLKKSFHFPLLLTPDEVSIPRIRPHLSAVDLVILDWNLKDGDDGQEAQAYAQLFVDNAVPVIIFTGDDNLKTAQGVIKEKGWENLVLALPKHEDSVRKIENHLKAEADLAVKVGLVWKPSARKAAFETLKEVRKLSHKSIGFLMHSAGKDALDVAEALTELFEQYLTSALRPDVTEIDGFIKQAFKDQNLATAVADVTEGRKLVAGEYDHVVGILQALQYDSLDKAGRIDTGDIIKFADDSYGVIITPRCKLARCNNDDPVTYIQAIPLNVFVQREPSPKDFIQSTWAVPDSEAFEFGLYDVPLTGGDQSIDLIADFTRVHTTTWDKCKTRLVRIRNPYRDALLHAYVRFILRYGVASPPYSEIKGERGMLKALAEEKARRRGL